MNLQLKPIAANLGTTDFIVGLCLRDLNEDSARQRVQKGQGPSIAWEVGHLLDHRVKMLALLGVEKENPYTACYTTRGASDGAEYPSLAEFERQWKEVAAELRVALESATEEGLGRVVERGPHGEKTAFEQLVFLTWHDAYHVGGMGRIRRDLGLAGPADLAMAAA